MDEFRDEGKAASIVAGCHRDYWRAEEDEMLRQHVEKNGPRTGIRSPRSSWDDQETAVD
ncbi:hypothetical protein SAY86_022364 [Trapa natans]|uniref:Uncharacterized protein n=1 Tax=Trapa natans TaxID=22666 RepID=A0AAN7R4D8_TRANT|nr:hypothetical protein SAY86_022364 [Trapa natans]